MKKWSYLIPVLLFAVALLFRFQTLHVPFWVDEFSSAYQANLLLRFGTSVIHNPTYYFEYQNVTEHVLIAAVFKLFGQTEFIARFPTMIIGALVPVALYYFGKKIINQSTALVAAILATFSYFMITWSRQARGYALQQLLVLLLFWLYFSVLDAKKHRLGLLGLLAVVSVLGVLTHTMFLIALIAMAIHFACSRREEFLKLLRQPLSYVFLGTLVVIAFVTGLSSQVSTHLSELFHGEFFNNFWYYHSFLWREYSLITFLGVIGLMIGLWTRRRSFSLLVIYIVGQLLFLSFFFGPYVSRYLLPIFPLFLLGMAYTITFGVEAISTFQRNAKTSRWMVLGISLVIVLGIIANGDKFTPKPKRFYSVDHDFREIALIDYDQVYGIIKAKGSLEEGKTAVIDTWGDRMLWYLGDDFKDGYIFRWVNDPGLMKQTTYTLNSDGEKVISTRNDARFIGELSDLQMAMKKYPKGFIWIDDSSLPQDVISFAQNNLQKEITLDHYTLDDNPYSIWPGTLYSWGIPK